MSQGKETIVEYLTSIPAWYLATVEETPEGAKPHVRPFSFARMQDGDIQFCTATTKDGSATSTAPGPPWSCNLPVPYGQSVEKNAVTCAV